MPVTLAGIIMLFKPVHPAKLVMPIRDWGRALNQFAIEFGKERVPF